MQELVQKRFSPGDFVGGRETEPKETVLEQAIAQEKTPASGGMDTRAL